MNETILYISKSEQDIRSFLKYLQSKLEAEQKECALDEKYDILKVPKYYDIVAKSVHGNRLGVGYMEMSDMYVVGELQTLSARETIRTGSL